MQTMTEKRSGGGCERITVAMTTGIHTTDLFISIAAVDCCQRVNGIVGR